MNVIDGITNLFKYNDPDFITYEDIEKRTDKYKSKVTANLDITDENHINHIFLIDKNNKLIYEKDSLGKENSYVYDDKGNLVKSRDAKGHIRYYAINE